MQFSTIEQNNFGGKIVLLRADLNVPVMDGEISDFTRIDRVKATIDKLCADGARILLCCHFGRPNGKKNMDFSTAFLKDVLSERWEVSVQFADDCIGDAVSNGLDGLQAGEVLLLENLRFHAGEMDNDDGFAKDLAQNADFFVNDAFSVSHRAHASTVGVCAHLTCYAGTLMAEELQALSKALEAPERPVMALVGGAKISTKLELLKNLILKVDVLVLGGGMANTFWYAQGAEMAKSLVERDMKETALEIMLEAKKVGCDIVLPVDGAIAREFKAHTESKNCDDLMHVDDGYMVLDIGLKSIENVREKLQGIKTVVWNGPMGAFEIEPFDHATCELAQAVACITEQGKIVSVAGGGDTVAALEHADAADRFTYISTAGGAFLEWLEGKALPGVEALLKTDIAAKSA